MDQRQFGLDFIYFNLKAQDLDSVMLAVQVIRSRNTESLQAADQIGATLRWKSVKARKWDQSDLLDLQTRFPSDRLAVASAWIRFGEAQDESNLFDGFFCTVLVVFIPQLSLLLAHLLRSKRKLAPSRLILKRPIESLVIMFVGTGARFQLRPLTIENYIR